MCFEIGCLIWHICISRCMRFVKGIGSKAGHFIKNFCSYLFAYTVFCTAVYKMWAFSSHNISFFLCHSTAHEVWLTIAVTCQSTAYLHYLFLVNNTAICNFQNILQQRMFIFNQLRIVSVPYKGRYRIHRARAVKRNNRYQVFYIHRFQVHQNIFHTAAFKLEHAYSITIWQHAESFFIVCRYSVCTEWRCVLLNHFFSVVNNCQCTQAQKVHFQQAQLLDGGHRELCNQLTVVVLQRNVFHNRFICDNNTCSMGGSISWHTFHFHSKVYKLFYLRVWIIKIFQFSWYFQCFFYCHALARCIWDKLCDFIHWRIGHIQHSAYITDSTAGRQCTESDNLAHMVIAVFFGNIINYQRAFFKAEVNIKVRHGNTLRI